MVGGVPLAVDTLQENVDRVRLQAAALGCPSSEIVCPAETLAGTFTNAIGRCAAPTAAKASSIPAPQVCVVQIHSAVCTSLLFAGTWQTGGAGVEFDVDGNGAADCFRRAITSAGR